MHNNNKIKQFSNQPHNNNRQLNDFLSLFSQDRGASAQSNSQQIKKDNFNGIKNQYSNEKSGKTSAQIQGKAIEEKNQAPPGSIQQISERKADELVLEKPKVQRVTYGMRNLGNTCFFNSVMQCLSHTKPLINYCLSGVHGAECKKSQQCFLCFYTQYLKGIQTQQKTNPQIIVSKLRSIWQRYSLGRQEDAHEFLIIFMENLVNSCFNMAKPPREFIYKNQNKTAVYQLIGGKSRSQVKCLGCGHCSNTYEDLATLSLEFPKRRQSGTLQLEECLSNFYSAEMLKGDNKYLCGGCKKKQEARKRFSIETTPRTLIIHLKRFTNFGTKIGEFVKYPASLSLKNFMSSTVDSQASKDSVSLGKVSENEIFDLYGVVVHQGGGCRSGHYFSYCKGFDGEWYDCNDDYVGRSKIDTAMRQQAYILFYQKRISSKPVEKPTPIPIPVKAAAPLPVTEDLKKSVDLQMMSTPSAGANLPGVIMSKTKIFQEDKQQEQQPPISIVVSGSNQKQPSLSNQSTSVSSSNNFLDENNSQTAKTTLEIKEQKPKEEVQQKPKPQDQEQSQIHEPLKQQPPVKKEEDSVNMQATAQEPPTKKLLTMEQKNQVKDEEIVLNPKYNIQLAIPFTSLRRDLHPLFLNHNSKKRKLEATMDIIRMPQMPEKRAAILKRFNCGINPKYVPPKLVSVQKTSTVSN